MEEKEFIVLEEHNGMRIDLYLAKHCLPDMSRSRIQKYIKDRVVRINDGPVNQNYHIKAHDHITFVSSRNQDEDQITPENIPLDIIYEDDDILIINKQPGLVVHPAAGNKSHTLVNALKYYLKDKLSTFGGEQRSGVVHRLDKETSGLMIIAKNDTAHSRIAKQFKDRKVKKSYIVIVKGVVQHDQGKCDQPIGKAKLFRKKMIVEYGTGKAAFSEYFVRERFKNATLLEVKIHTGRTHQIRVHMAYIGHPVLGDLVYGVRTPLIARQCLHASKLIIEHPTTKKSILFEAPLPDDIQKVIRALKEQNE